MLKIITTVRDNPESVTVHLYGQFTGDYVPEVEKVLAGHGANNHKVKLNLANVTFVDRAGMMFLYAAQSGEIAVENIPSYVRRWIEQEGRYGSEHPDPC